MATIFNESIEANTIDEICDELENNENIKSQHITSEATELIVNGALYTKISISTSDSSELVRLVLTSNNEKNLELFITKSEYKKFIYSLTGFLNAFIHETPTTPVTKKLIKG